MDCVLVDDAELGDDLEQILGSSYTVKLVSESPVTIRVRLNRMYDPSLPTKPTHLETT